MTIEGLHHITIGALDAQRTVDFYTTVLGLRFVKKTVNFDDPGSTTSTSATSKAGRARRSRSSNGRVSRTGVPASAGPITWRSRLARTTHS